MKNRLIEYLQQRATDRENIMKGLHILLVNLREDGDYMTGFLTELGREYWDQFTDVTPSGMFSAYGTVKSGIINRVYYVTLQMSMRTASRINGNRMSYSCNHIKQKLTLRETIEEFLLLHLTK